MSQLKPENALKKGEELIHAKNKTLALDVLQEALNNRRTRQWQKPYEPLMLKLVDLCVDLRRGREAKDSLSQYRAMCQSTNPISIETRMASLENVFRRFLESAENRLAEAVKQNAQATVDVADLEADDAPENLLLSLHDERGVRDNTTAWFKFMWEAYRNVLDLLKSNLKLDALYQSIVQRAFAFCLKYQRRSEFKKLSETVRRHTANLEQRLASYADATAIHMETKYKQLTISVELELWQEAFRFINELKYFALSSKRPMKSAMLIGYFEQMSRIFLVCRRYLLHAFAQLRIFGIQRSKANLSKEELTAAANSLLLASLASPCFEQRNPDPLFETDLTREREAGLLSLLGFNLTPSRETLMHLISTARVVDVVNPEMRDLFQAIEVDFDPLGLADRVNPIFETLKKDAQWAAYIQPLQEAAAMRVLQQASKVFKTMRTADLFAATSFMSRLDLERLLVEACRSGSITASINHQKGVITFGYGNNVSAEADSVKSQLVNLARHLETAVRTMLSSPKEQEERTARKKALFDTVIRNMGIENRRLLSRKQLIEDRKVRSEEDARIAAQQAEAAAKLAEEKRLADKEAQLEEQTRQRDAERAAREKEEAKRKLIVEQAKLLVQRLPKGSDLRKKLTQDPSCPDITDVNALFEAERLDIENEQNKKLKQLSEEVKEADYLERALREEEKPALARNYEKVLKDDKAAYDKKIVSDRAKHEAEHKQNLVEKARLWRMLEAQKQFYDEIMARRRIEYENAKASQDRRRAQKKAQFEAEQAKKKEMYEANLREIERKKSEAENRRRAALEAEEQKKKAAEDQRRKDRELIELRQKREQEAEERQRQAFPGGAAAAGGAGKYVPPSRRAEVPSAPSTPSSGPTPAAAAAPSSGGYVPPHLRNKAASAPAPVPAAGGRDLSGLRDMGGDAPRQHDRDAPRDGPQQFGGAFNRSGTRDGPSRDGQAPRGNFSSGPAEPRRQMDRW